MRYVSGTDGSWRAVGQSVAGRMFFAADDGVSGAELWSYTP